MCHQQKIVLFSQNDKIKSRIFSVDLYYFPGQSIIIKPHESFLIFFSDYSLTLNYHPINQYYRKYTKKYVCSKMFKFGIFVTNTSSKHHLIVRTNCALKKLLQHRHISHTYTYTKANNISKYFRFKCRP